MNPKSHKVKDIKQQKKQHQQDDQKKHKEDQLEANMAGKIENRKLNGELLEQRPDNN